MDVTAWALYALLAAAALAGAAFHYRRREPPGRGRVVLGLLRGAAIAVLLLLLFDPAVPVGPGSGRGRVVLVDASLSMGLPSEAGRTRWDEAMAAIADRGVDRVELFGQGPARSLERSRDAGPTLPASRLAPALRSALEAGARRVTVVTDGALEDLAEVRRLANRAGGIEVLRVGASTAFNAGLVEARAPRWVEPQETTAVEVAVARVGGDGPDSLDVAVLRDGRELARGRVVTPATGSLAATTLRFAPGAGQSGPVRLDVVLLANDAAADDDRRTIYVRIGEEPAGLALVSFRPDQEPRFLLPVLERALGVPARGWLRTPGDRYLRVGLGRDAGMVAGEADVRRAVGAAGVVVLHGLTPEAPDWARRAAGQAGRILVFPAAAALEELPFAPGPSRAGDWYVTGSVPASPVAPVLAGIDPAAAPPLVSLRTPASPVGLWAPIEARQGRRGEPRPVLLAGRSGGRRVAVALGEGYWRWAFSEGGGRGLYDRLWSAIGGWLAEDGGAGAIVVRPDARVVARGEPLRWLVPGDTDSVRVTLRDPDRAGQAVLDTAVAPSDGVAVTAAMAPGTYDYAVRAGDSEDAGELTVESYSPELTREAGDLRLDAAGPGSPGSQRAGERRPLHATPWPYIAVVLLLCAEWVLRRRWGLR
jgi:hypothetical protein